MQRLLLRWFLGAALLTFAPTLIADPDHPTPAESERAHDLFEKSKPLQDAKKYADAEKLLLEAWSLQHSPDVAANLGMCQASMSKYRDAAEHLSFAWKNITAGASNETRAKIKKAFDLVKREVVTVHLTVQPDGAEISVDDAPIGKAPLTDDVFVEPGTRRISATASGFTAHTETLVAKKGDTKSIDIHLEAEKDPGSGVAPAPSATATSSAPAPVPTGDTIEPSSGIRPKTAVMIAEGGLAAVGLGVGIGFLLGKNSASDDRDQLRQQSITQVGSGGCATQPNAQVCVDLKDADDRVHRDGTLSTVGFVGAGVALVGLGATWLLWQDSNAEKPSVGFDPLRRSVIVSGKF